MTYKVLVLPGDGIGTEVMASAIDVLKALEKKVGKQLFEFEYDLIGGCAYDKYGKPLADETLAKAREADAVLLGAVGGYKWDKLSISDRPEAGLLGIRKGMGLYANIRPAKIFPDLVNKSPLKAEYVKGMDVMIVRELIGGLYFGEPRGIIEKDGEPYGFNTMCYKKSEIERVGKLAFELSQKRRKKVICVDKANILVTMKLWRDTITELSKNYSEVALSYSYIDAMSMELVKRPTEFDVVVCENTFGDILSDLASAIVGSIGLLPSASLGDINPKTGIRSALYEPIHGSAPDIAGQNKANPIATILSTVMMLRYSFDMQKEADIIEKAVEKFLQKYRTADIWQEGFEKLGTNDVAAKIAECM
ncbi:MAG: 3-isopropylmalate dehydrogenase [Rickettsiales bacterium]|nr:3-isopropylmalate dehydrogenase [Rickettsiales bacterium]